MKDVFGYICSCLCLRSCCNNGNHNSKLDKHNLFMRGSERVNHDLDIANVIRTNI